MGETGSRVRQSRKAGGGQDFWPSDQRPGGSGAGRSKLFFGAAALLAVVVVAGAVAYFVLGGGSKDAAGSGQTTLAPPTVYVPSPASSGTKALNDRKADNRPLNAGEVFTDKAKTVNAGSYTFNRVAQDLSGDCTSTTYGAALQADLKQYGCTQVVRASYLSTDKKHSGQIIAINLDSVAGASKVIADMTPDGTGKTGFVKPLPGPGVVNFGAGFSAAYPTPFGHYVLIPWVERNGGAKPASMNELIDASLALEPANDFAWQRLLLAKG